MKEFVTRKFAGVPTWGWIAIVAGGAGLFIYLRSRQSGDTGTAGQGPDSTGGSSGADGSVPTGNPPPAPPSPNDCADPRNFRWVKNPDGKPRLVCPPTGHFVRSGPGWHWVPGPARRPTIGNRQTAQRPPATKRVFQH